jgi:hypothetical protein
MMRLGEAVEALRSPMEHSRLRARIESEYPLVTKALRLVDMRNGERRRSRGYSLAKRENKTTGITCGTGTGEKCCRRSGTRGQR